MKEEAAKNLSESKTFRAEDGKKDGIKTLPSGLEYKVVADWNDLQTNPDVE